MPAEELQSDSTDVNTDVDLERQMRDLRRYVETGDSPYKDGFIIISTTRLTIKKLREKGVDTSIFEEELNIMEPAVKKRYVSDKIHELELNAQGKTVIRKEELINTAKLIRQRLNKLEESGIDVSDLKERFGALQKRR
jgi:hypothetical protein